MASKEYVSVDRELDYLAFLLDYNNFYPNDYTIDDLSNMTDILETASEMFKKKGFPKINADFFIFAGDHSIMSGFPSIIAQAELLGLQAGLLNLYYKKIEEYIYDNVEIQWEGFEKVGSIEFKIDDSDPEFPKGILTYIVNNITAFKKLIKKYFSFEYDEYFADSLSDYFYTLIHEGDEYVKKYISNLRNEWFYADDKVMYEELEYLLKDFIEENKSELKRLYAFWLTTLDKNV